MSQTMTEEPQLDNRHLLTVLAIVLLIAGVLFWLHDRIAGTSPAMAQAAPVAVNSVADLQSLKPEQVEVMQKQATAAALDATGIEPLQGTVTQRPDYVSPVEWQVLKMVASQSDDRDAELTRLVNKLRFSKQVELWQAGVSPSQQTALAQQVLVDIPGQVASGSLDRGAALQLQGSVLAQLYPDEGERLRHRAAEAEKIGVKFDIQKQR